MGLNSIAALVRFWLQAVSCYFSSLFHPLNDGFSVFEPYLSCLLLASLRNKTSVSFITLVTCPGSGPTLSYNIKMHMASHVGFWVRE